MSDYQRFLSYLHEYRQNRKMTSCGFIRFFRYETSCRIELHMKMVAPSSPPVLHVSAFLPCPDGLLGVPLGQAQAKRGAVRAAYSLPADTLRAMGYTLNDLGGVVIVSDTNRVFASSWRDEPIHPERLFFREAAADLPDENLHDADLPAADLHDAGLHDADLPAADLHDADLHDADVPEEAGTNPPANADPAGALPPSGETAAEPEMTQEEESPAPAPEPKGKPDPWGWLCASRPAVTPFFDDEIPECIRVTRADLAALAAHGFPVEDNAFLQRACQSFGHFLICRTERAAGDPASGFLLAVPGLYNEKERLLARQFRFFSFTASRGALISPGVFGYWRRPLP